jgi:hypothetical protein
MHRRVQNKIFAGALVALVMAPAFASAQTTDTQNQVQSLLQQIQALQMQLKTLLASSTGSWTMSSSANFLNTGQMGKFVCITLGRNLRQGDQGEDVRKLQEMLMGDSDNEFNGTATGFFGPLTMKAMMKFQMRMGIASTTDGSVGPKTRGFFERACGKGLTGQNVGQGVNGLTGQGKIQGGDMMMAIRGTISANNTSSIIVQTDGGSITANITSSTMIKVFVGTSTPPTQGTIADLVVGKNVMVEGKKTSENTMEAVHVAVGDNIPMMKMIRGMKDGNGVYPPPLDINKILRGLGQGGSNDQSGGQNW